MTSSPFAPFANSELRFEVASGELVTDEKKGNVRPGKAVVAVTALLQQKRDPNREPRPGVDSSAIWLEGYIVAIANQTTLDLPSIVTPDSPCAIVWQGRKGQFFMEFTARNAYLAALNIDLVERIRGYFQPNSFVVEGDPYVPPTPQPEPVSGNLIKVPFGFGDATPKPIHLIAAGQTVFTAQIVIQTPFNGIGASLSIGDAVVSDRLMNADQVDPSFAAEYETNPGHTYLAPTQIYLTITPGAGATQGAGFVLLEI